MRPGRFASEAGSRRPALHGKQLLLTGSRSLHELPHTVAQHLSRGFALGAARRHELLAKVALDAEPQSGIFDLQSHRRSVICGYTLVYPIIDGYSPVGV